MRMNESVGETGRLGRQQLLERDDLAFRRPASGRAAVAVDDAYAGVVVRTAEQARAEPALPGEQAGAVRPLVPAQSAAVAGFPLFDQDDVAGDPNACGPTALAMILADEGLIPNSLQAAKDLDAEVRMRGARFGTGAQDIVNGAEAHGLHGSIVNGASFGELQQALGNGNHVMAMIDSGSAAHWIDVLEVKTYKGGQQAVVYADPSTGSIREMPRAEFERRWQNPMQNGNRFLGDVMGEHNLMIALNKDGSRLPPTRLGRASSVEMVEDGFSDAYKGFGDIGDGHWGRGLRGIASGGWKMGVALPGAIGSFGRAAGNRMQEWGRDMRDSGNPFAWGAGVAVQGAGALVEGAGRAVEAVGNVVSDIGRSIGNIFGW